MNIKAAIERLEALVQMALDIANAAAAAAGGTGYSVIIDESLQIPSDGASHTIASYDLTAIQRAAYIEFQWVVHDPTTGNIATRRQGSAFQDTGSVGTVDNISNIKTNMAFPPSFLFQTLGTILVSQVSVPIGNGHPVNVRAVIKIQFET